MIEYTNPNGITHFIAEHRVREIYVQDDNVYLEVIGEDMARVAVPPSDYANHARLYARRLAEQVWKESL